MKSKLLQHTLIVRHHDIHIANITRENIISE